MANTDPAAVLIGVYYSCDQAEKALDQLKRSGFREDQLRVTLCNADFADDTVPSLPPAPHSAKRAAISLGAVGGTLLGTIAAAVLLCWLPVLAVPFGAGLGIGAITGAVAGAILGICAGWRRRVNPVAPIIRTRRLSRGVVTVRPHHRYAEAAAILRHFAGCDATPPSPVGT